MKRYCTKKLIAALLLLFLCFTMYAQQKDKIPYNHTLDSLWSAETMLQDVAKDGKWISFLRLYDSQPNKITALNTETKKEIDIQNGQRSYFLNNWWVCYTTKQELIIRNLNSANYKKYDNIISFDPSMSGNFIAALDNQEKLIAIDLAKSTEIYINNVKKFSWNSQEDILLLASHENGIFSVSTLHTPTNTSELLQQLKASHIDNLEWVNKKNITYTAVENSGIENIYFYNTKKSNSLSSPLLDNFKNYNIDNIDFYAAESEDRIVFKLNKNNVKDRFQESEIQEWNSDDPWVFPKLKYYSLHQKNSIWLAWYPTTNQLIQLNDTTTPSLAIHRNHKHFICFDVLKYEPQFKQFQYMDLYVVNAETGVKKLIENKTFNLFGNIIVSPKGNYITYYKDNSLWIYDIEKNQYTEVSNLISHSVINPRMQRAGNINIPYGIGGWATDEGLFYFYDEYDIWAYAPQIKQLQNLTNGRSNKTTYRIYNDNNYNLSLENSFANFSCRLINNEKEILLSINNEENKGIAVLDEKGEMRIISLDFNRYKNYFLDKKDNIYYQKESYNTVPSIYSYNLKKGIAHLLHKSNQEIENYDFGKAKKFKYQTKDNRELNAVLIYPANFDPSKKYPMIVQVYENTTDNYYNFIAPSVYQQNGFCATKYAISGYFVLFPDIEYELGNPGISASECIINAVEKMLEFEYIDENKIGLIGHSFGGYETAFTITQTDIFATAVAGAPATDLVNMYHDIAWDFNTSQMWRFENQQLRMGKSFYDIPDNYYQNSPLHQVKNINTPLMLWTGKNDYNVNWHHSINLYQALYRLKKKSKLFIYEEEGHVMSIPKNQKHLYNKISNWFEKWLN